MEDGRIVAALAGNPNVGKSSIFNGLTGLHQHTGKYRIAVKPKKGVFMEKQENISAETMSLEQFSDLALDAERVYALHLALWQAIQYGKYLGTEYDMGFDAVSNLLYDIKERLGELAL